MSLNNSNSRRFEGVSRKLEIAGTLELNVYNTKGELIVLKHSGRSRFSCLNTKLRHFAHTEC